MNNKKNEQKNKVGRPKKGNEKKVSTSVRIEPTIKLMLMKKYGSFSKAINTLIISEAEKIIRGEK